MKFTDHSSQIKELIMIRNEIDYEDLFDKILFGMNDSDKFLIKMELNRLKTPCSRVIDLRSKTLTPCTIYECKDLRHYLTKGAIETLLYNIDLYGRYTIGVFEAVIEQQIKEKNELQRIDKEVVKTHISEDCEKIRLSQQDLHTATRMFFFSEIKLTLPNNKTYQGYTSNISTSGLKIKLIEPIEIENHKKVKIEFTELYKRNRQIILQSAITYLIVKQEVTKDVQYFYLSYCDNKQELVNFFDSFIKNNQYKYKLDLNYTYQQAVNKSLKYAYLSQMTQLPIYLNSNSPDPYLCALINDSNVGLLSYWSINDQNHLSLFFSQDRVLELAAETTMYCFTHTSNQHCYYLAASEEDLIAAGVKDLFINFGRLKQNWKVFNLSKKDYKYNSMEEFSFTETNNELFHDVTDIVVIKELLDFDHQISNETYNKTEIVKLNKFILSKTVIKSAPAYRLFPSEKRVEARYNYKSHITIYHDHHTYKGNIVNFSLSGLCIYLDRELFLSSNTKLLINFHDFQKITEKYNLLQLEYKTIGITSGHSVRLVVYDQNTFEITSDFFKNLVQSNPKQFPIIPIRPNKQPNSDRLMELAENSLFDSIFFLSRTQNSPKIQFGSIEHKNSRLHQLFTLFSENKEHFNYYPLINNEVLERLLLKPFAKKKITVQEAYIYIKVGITRFTESSVYSYLEEDFHSPLNKNKFLTKLKANEELFILHFKISPFVSPSLKCAVNEIEVLSKNAPHLVNKLVDEILPINAVIEISDHTSLIVGKNL